MTDAEIKARVNDLEDHFTERKTGREGRREFRRQIVAFANSVPENRTAVLFLGVRNNGEICGVENCDKLQKTIREIYENECYPAIQPLSRVLNEGDRNYIAVLISYSENRPHFGGQAWVRKGTETVVASEEVFQELIDSRTSKVGEILKWKNQTVRVEAIGKRLGDTKPLRDAGYSEAEDCIVQGCTSHVLRLHKVGSQRDVTEPLENVTITEDAVTRRLKLIIRPPR